MGRRHSKYDRLAVGFVPGLVLPFLIFIGIFLVKGNSQPLSDYIAGLWTFNVLIKLMSLCVFPNLFFFLYLMRKRHDMAARGVMIATFIYAFVVVFSKLI